MQGQAHQNKLLLFQVGPVKCSLFSNDILTIIPPPRQETAGHNGRLPGMFRHNNRIVRVVDMRSKFGLSPSTPERGRLILAEIPKGLVGFWVDQIINVIDQSDGRWDLLPAALPHDVFTRTFVLDEELILHTECQRMEAMRPSAGLTQHIESLQKRESENVLTPAKPPGQTMANKPTTVPASQVEAGSPQSARQQASAANKPSEVARPPARSTATKPVASERPKPPQPEPPKPSVGSTRPSSLFGSSERRPGITPSGDKARSPIATAGHKPPASAANKPGPGGRPEIPAPPRRPASPPPPRPSFQASTPPPTARVQTKAAMEPTEPPSGEGNGLLWLFLGLLLLLLGGGATLLYVNGMFDTGEETASLAQQGLGSGQSSEPAVAVENTETESVTTAGQETATPAPGTSDQASGETVETSPTSEPPSETPVTTAPQAESPVPPSETLQADSQTAPANGTAGEKPDSAYSADIQKDDRGITITLNGPEKSSPNESLLKEPEQAQEPPASEAEPPPSEPTESDTDTSSEVQSPQATASPPPQTGSEQMAPAAEPKHKPSKPKKARSQHRHGKPGRHVITHVVVKGDTLWAIAKRYVKDPFRYPELARLSGIKDPDRIYPGDIVRIIEK